MVSDVLSKEAAELIKVVTTFGGYDKVELMARILTRTTKKANITTVENILQEMYEEGQLNGLPIE